MHFVIGGCHAHYEMWGYITVVLNNVSCFRAKQNIQWISCFSLRYAFCDRWMLCTLWNAWLHHCGSQCFRTGDKLVQLYIPTSWERSWVGEGGLLFQRFLPWFISVFMVLESGSLTCGGNKEHWYRPYTPLTFEWGEFSDTLEYCIPLRMYLLLLEICSWLVSGRW